MLEKMPIVLKRASVSFSGHPRHLEKSFRPSKRFTIAPNAEMHGVDFLILMTITLKHIVDFLRSSNAQQYLPQLAAELEHI